MTNLDSKTQKPTPTLGQTSNSFLFTSESVTEGHPDKVADFISDTILDTYLEQDPMSRVACETLVTTGLAVIAGEISTTSKKDVNIEKIVRDAIMGIGYNRPEEGFTGDSCKVLNHLHAQSPDIAVGVDRGEEIGAGDQGLMFGYACTETSDYMPLCISLAHKISQSLSQKRKSKELPWLRPDGKTQVTVEYRNGKAYKIDTVVVSTQHLPNVTHAEIFERVKREIVEPLLPQNLVKGEIKYHINPTGIFVVGGPHGDTGLTGRKIIVDTYGGYAPHGGGAFSGKDPTKVDRSAAYMTRYIAKNIVAAGLADEALVQVAYAIGVAEPVSLMIDFKGTEKADPEKIKKAVKELFPMKPADIIKKLDLRKPIYRRSTNYGHFGRGDAGLSWEKTDMISELKGLL